MIRRIFEKFVKQKPWWLYVAFILDSRQTKVKMHHVRSKSDVFILNSFYNYCKECFEFLICNIVLFIIVFKLKLEELLGHKVLPVMSFTFYLLLLPSLQWIVWNKRNISCTLKEVFAKNERGYRLTAKNKGFWWLLILLLSAASISRKL